MGTILIKTDKDNGRILSDLAKKLGSKVLSISDSQYDDILLGKLMDTVKTGKTVSRELILKKLKSK